MTKNNVPAAGSATDTYSTSLISDLGGAAQPAIWGNDFNTFVTYDFTLTSTGASVRNATSAHVQGIAVLAPLTPDYGPAGGGGAGGVGGGGGTGGGGVDPGTDFSLR